MVLLLSEYEDNMTDKVCAYLNFYNEPYLRLNKVETEGVFNYVLFENNKIDIRFTFKKVHYSLNDFKSIWFRRGRFHFQTHNIIDGIFEQEIRTHMSRERDTLVYFIYDFIIRNKKYKVLNNPLKYNVNKLQSITIAMECGLKIPPTIITNTNPKKNGFDYERLITKNIQDNVVGFSNGINITGVETQRVKNSNIKSHFFFSKFQKEIEKKYELRIFYLDGLLYSLAYLYSNSEVDSRILNEEKIRYVPFILPKGIEKKIIVYMNAIGLNCGSIDMIVNHDDDFYFLEVNPVGQFDFLNNFGNFQIEKDIAKYLINEKQDI